MKRTCRTSSPHLRTRVMRMRDCRRPPQRDMSAEHPTLRLRDIQSISKSLQHRRQPRSQPRSRLRSTSLDHCGTPDLAPVRRAEPKRPRPTAQIRQVASRSTNTRRQSRELRPSLRVYRSMQRLPPVSSDDFPLMLHLVSLLQQAPRPEHWSASLGHR